MQTWWDPKGERRRFDCLGVNKPITAYSVRVWDEDQLQEVGPEFVAGIVSFAARPLCGFILVENGCAGPAITWHAFAVFSLFWPLPSPLLFLKVPRDRSSTYKIMCLFVWVSGKLEGFHRETCDFFFFTGLSQPVLVKTWTWSELVINKSFFFIFIKMLFVELALLS